MDTLQTYEYPECADAAFVPSWNGWERVPDVGEANAGVGSQSASEATPKVADQRHLAEETHRTFEAGRTRGIAQGRELEKAAHALAIAKVQEEQIRQAAELITNFERERCSYFQAAEQEVVKLALAVAARILRRTAHADPLLLMGAVRVALGQVAASTEVRLRVPPKDLDLWTEAIALLPNLGIKPQVLEGEGMLLGECVIETSLGSADLGIPSQLAEIERVMVEQQRSKRADPGPANSITAASLEVSQ